MYNITRSNTPTLQREAIRGSYECDTCGRVARSYMAMTVRDNQTKYFCTHRCFRDRSDFEMCYMCYKMADTGRRVAAGAGQVFLCSKQCERAYEMEIFN